MKKRLACLLALLLLLNLTACGQPQPVPTQSQPPEVTVVPESARPFALGYDPTASLHPITGDSQVNLELAGLVYQGLYELDNRFEAHPVLAQSAEVDESGLVWTITIREGIVFSDGTPLTVDHVAASLKAARGSKQYGARLSGVSAVWAKGGVVTITLSAPNGKLPSLLDIPVVLEQEAGPPLGTGRYRFVTEGEQLTLRVNGNYDGWKELPYEAIPLVAADSTDRRIAAFDSGEVTAVTTDFSSSYALGYSGSYELYDYPTTNLLYVGFQTTKGACASAEVRQACACAFDRVSVVQSLLAGHGDPASLPIHSDHEGYDEAAAALLDYDVESAQALLEQAGYKLKEEDGLRYKGRAPLTVTLLVNRDNGVKQELARCLADSLTALGITVTLRELGWTDYKKALEQGDFDLYIGEIRLTGDFDVTELLVGSLNYGGYTSETLPGLLAAWKAAREWDGPEAAALWAELAAAAPIAPLCFKRNSLLVRWGVATDLQPTRADPYRGMEQWNVQLSK